MKKAYLIIFVIFAYFAVCAAKYMITGPTGPVPVAIYLATGGLAVTALAFSMKAK